MSCGRLSASGAQRAFSFLFVPCRFPCVAAPLLATPCSLCCSQPVAVPGPSGLGGELGGGTEDLRDGRGTGESGVLGLFLLQDLAYVPDLPGLSFSFCKGWERTGWAVGSVGSLRSLVWKLGEEGSGGSWPGDHLPLLYCLMLSHVLYLLIFKKLSQFGSLKQQRTNGQFQCQCASALQRPNRKASSGPAQSILGQGQVDPQEPSDEWRGRGLTARGHRHPGPSPGGPSVLLKSLQVNGGRRNAPLQAPSLQGPWRG